MTDRFPDPCDQTPEQDAFSEGAAYGVDLAKKRIATWVSEQADLADKGLRAATDSEEEAWFRGRMVALSEAERFIKEASNA